MPWVSKIGKHDVIMTEVKETKALKMKSAYIMAEKTWDVIKRGGKVTEATTLDYEKLKKVVERERGEIFKRGNRFQINVLTHLGWRAPAQGFFGKNEAIKWYDPALDYGDDSVVGTVYMIEVRVLGA